MNTNSEPRASVAPHEVIRAAKRSCPNAAKAQKSTTVQGGHLENPGLSVAASGGETRRERTRRNDNSVEFEGVPISRLVDMRHKLTALIKQNLYGGGSKSEGQAALMARNLLDDFVFRITDDMLVEGGNPADLVTLKRAIILETYAELLRILDDYSRRFGRGGKAVKQGMSTVLSEPDVFGRFNGDHQTKIHAIAAGSSLFAKWRFYRLHLSIRTEAGRYM